MPLYDYACDDCGPFREWRGMSEAGSPAECPSCSGPSGRTVSAPFLAAMNPYTRIAHQRNEKAAHEPQVMTRAQLDKSGRRRSPSHGHAHGHGNGQDHHGPGHIHRSSQRWMLGH